MLTVTFHEKHPRGIYSPYWRPNYHIHFCMSSTIISNRGNRGVIAKIAQLAVMVVESAAVVKQTQDWQQFLQKTCSTINSNINSRQIDKIVALILAIVVVVIEIVTVEIVLQISGSMGNYDAGLSNRSLRSSGNSANSNTFTVIIAMKSTDTSSICMIKICFYCFSFLSLEHEKHAMRLHLPITQYTHSHSATQCCKCKESTGH